jgi:hypothetical protein
VEMVGRPATVVTDAAKWALAKARGTGRSDDKRWSPDARQCSAGRCRRRQRQCHARKRLDGNQQLAVGDVSHPLVAATDGCRSFGVLATLVGFFGSFPVEIRGRFLAVFKGKT